MIKPALALTTTLLAASALTGCSIDSGSSATKTSATSAKINGVTVKAPTGYTYAGQTNDTATSTTTMFLDAKGMPTYYRVATNATGFSISDYCTLMAKSFTSSYAKGAKITKNVTATSCTIEGHGKTPATGSSPSGSAAPSGYTAKTVPGNTEFSNYTEVTKAKNGAYVAMLSRHLGSSTDFSVAKTIFTSVTK